MRKILLSLSLCLLAIAANAQTPGISITEEVLYCWEEGMESANSVTFADGAKATSPETQRRKSHLVRISQLATRHTSR